MRKKSTQTWSTAKHIRSRQAEVDHSALVLRLVFWGMLALAVLELVGLVNLGDAILGTAVLSVCLVSFAYWFDRRF